MQHSDSVPEIIFENLFLKKMQPMTTEACKLLKAWSLVLATGIQIGIGHSPKIVPDVRVFAVQFSQFVRDDFRKRTLYGNAHWCNSIYVL